MALPIIFADQRLSEPRSIKSHKDYAGGAYSTQARLHTALFHNASANALPGHDKKAK
jgi:hypothetical protein